MRTSPVPATTRRRRGNEEGQFRGGRCVPEVGPPRGSGEAGGDASQGRHLRCRPPLMGTALASSSVSLRSEWSGRAWMHDLPGEGLDRYTCLISPPPMSTLQRGPELRVARPLYTACHDAKGQATAVANEASDSSCSAITHYRPPRGAAFFIEQEINKVGANPTRAVGVRPRLRERGRGRHAGLRTWPSPTPGRI